MDKDVVYFGQWNYPQGWSELTLKQFQDISRAEAKDTRDILQILANKTIDEVNELPLEFAEKMLNDLKWLYEEPKIDEPTNKIIIDDVTYVVNTQEKLRTGEFIAIDTALKGDNHNYAALLAILCRKEGEKYDSTFENEVLPERIKMFENVSFIKIMPIVNFFFECYMIYQKNFQLYSLVEEQIESTRQRIESFPKNGVLSKLFTRWLMRKLKKLQRSIKFT
jgi:hypothetical protein